MNQQETITHSTESAKLPRGPSPDNCARLVVFSPVCRNVQAVFREGGLISEMSDQVIHNEKQTKNTDKPDK